jgi:8-amino-7-oxononanoate synthase
MLSANKSTTVNIEGKDYLYFGGTNFLGIAHRKEILDAAGKAFADWGWSSGASRLTSGENDILVALERELAEFAGAGSAVVLPAGFLSNQAVVEGLDPEVDAWVIPEHAHASIHSAVKQARKPVIVIRDWQELEAPEGCVRRQLESGSQAVLGIFAEPVEPLTGKLSAIGELVEKCSPLDFIVLDEAQSFGVLGECGRGALEHFALSGIQRLVRSGTFSKAVGTYGGFVLAARAVIDLIKQRSSCSGGSTSLPPLLCAASRESLRLIQEDAGSTVVRLKKNIALLNQLLSEAGFAPENGHCAPIYYMPCSPEVVRIRDLLLQNNIYIPSMSSYFPQDIGLRWTIQSGHSQADLRKLVGVFASSRSQ